VSHGQANEDSIVFTREILVTAAVVVAGMILAILDATIVNVAIPTLGRDLSASIGAIQWVMTAYLLAFASVIPVSGWASARFGAKRVWVAALLVFLAGSVLSGAAWSIQSLIAFRVVQGLGAGLIMPIGQTILAQAAGPQRMGRVMSVVGVPMLLAPIFGPVIGGAIVDTVSWRWIFFVNLPVGALAVFLAMRVLHGTVPDAARRLDVRGLTLLSPGLAVLVYGLSEAGASSGFESGRALTGITIGLALIAMFTWHAVGRGGNALLDVGLFARRGFAAAAATNLLVGVALFGALLLLPLYYQLVRGESPLTTGLLLIPQGLGAALAMPVAGRLADEIGARVVIPVGLALALAGTAAFTTIGAGTSYFFLAGALFLVGLGLGATIVPSMAVAYQSVPREAIGGATSVINVIQRVAGSVGTALLAVVLQRSITGQVNGAGIGEIAALSNNARTQAAPVLADAFGNTFWVAFALVAAAFVPALLLPRVEARRDRHSASAAEPAASA
jgi:EmrB/QacA subfamily drug resistance transporter